jgi:hypothetical protein
VTETPPTGPAGSTWTRRTFLRHRRLLFSAGIATLTLLGIGWWSQDAVRRTVEDRLRSELETALNANVTALELWIKGQLRTATLLATDPTICTPALSLLSTHIHSTGGPQGQPDPGFSDNLDERLATAGYQAAVLVSTNGRIVATSGRIRLRPGTPIPTDQADLFHRVVTTGKPALMTPFKPGRSPRFGGGMRGPGGSERPVGEAGRNPRPPGPPPGLSQGPQSGPEAPGGPPRGELQVMQVLVPIRSEQGEVAGVLAVVVRPEAEFTRVLSVARPGTSGETFGFDPEGRLLSQSRFDEQLRSLGLLTNGPGSSSALNVILRDPGGDLSRGYIPTQASLSQPLMRLVSDALNTPAGVTVNPVRDYRGVPVVGAWHWLEEHHFGVVTKIDAAEAFQPLRVLRLIFQLLLLLVALATLTGLVGSHLSTVWRRRFNEAQLRARQLGQYTLVEKIGEGAMGVVYRARHALLRRETAIKLLLPDRADEELIRQFEHEVQLTCRLTHPNTIQVFDYGHTTDGIFYYAMELLEGMTLQQLIDRGGAIPQERAIHLLRQAAGSLQEAHLSGLIHRDIKPGNLFLCRRGGMPDTLKVLDFGLVRDASLASNLEASRASRFLGTPLYMAPETIQTPGHGDVQSDIYALGAVAYLLVTGQPVFRAPTIEELWEMHAHQLPLPPRQISLEPISGELEALILRCLSKDPSERPASMAEFLADLNRCPGTFDWTEDKRHDWWRHHSTEGRAHPSGHAIETRIIQTLQRED